MLSAAHRHFPQIVYLGEKRRLWNPILRKAFKNRPEERVRLRLIDYLILEAGWSPHRISLELPLKLRHDEHPKRADILCYRQDFTPALLIECKAEKVTLNLDTSRQIAAYNTKINASYLMVSNGLEDFYFRVDEDGVNQLKQKPGILACENAFKTDFHYWKSRGFAGNDASPVLRPWLTDVLNSFWDQAQNNIGAYPRYLEFRHQPGYFPLNHYYRIFNLEKDIKLAISFISTPFGGNRMVGIINQRGINTGVIELNLELYLQGSELNTTILSSGVERVVDASPFIRLEFNTFNPGQLAELPGRMLALFNHSNT